MRELKIESLRVGDTVIVKSKIALEKLDQNGDLEGESLEFAPDMYKHCKKEYKIKTINTRSFKLEGMEPGPHWAWLPKWVEFSRDGKRKCGTGCLYHSGRNGRCPMTDGESCIYETGLQGWKAANPEEAKEESNNNEDNDGWSWD